MQSENTITYGQYFTPRLIADFMVERSTRKKDIQVLDPCAGAGVFIESLTAHGFKNILGYEVDTRFSLLHQVVNKSFVSEMIPESFDLIIGNPPYVRWKNLDKNLKEELLKDPLWKRYCNSLCDYLYIFILKSIQLLKENGELIFITPEYWLTTKHAQPLRDYMLENGYLEELFIFNETPIFKTISTSTIIFKYIKTKNKKKIVRVISYNSRKMVNKKILDAIQRIETYPDTKKFFMNQPSKGEKWSIINHETEDSLDAFEKKCDTTLGEIADIGNGMVSGLDSAFQLSQTSPLTETEMKNVLHVVKSKDLEQYTYTKETTYLFPQGVEDENTLKKDYPYFYEQLQPYKQKLLQRYNYGKNIYYWHWVFLRNYALFRKKKLKIFVPCKERISHKKYVRFALITENVFPTQDVTSIVLKDNLRESIHYVLAFLNSSQVFQWIQYKGVRRGNILEFSEAPLSSIPIRRINWASKKEVLLHDEISELVRTYLFQRNADFISVIHEKVTLLLAAK